VQSLEDTRPEIALGVLKKDAMSELDATKLRELRRRRGFSQEEMARRAGVDERTIRRAELGQTQPHPETLRIFAITLGVDVSDLFAERARTPGMSATHELPTGPVLAVLPFAEWDPASVEPHGYFSSGLLEDLVARLSMMRLFPVISRNSTLQLAHSTMAPREICESLGARYVVEGSIRRDALRMRMRVSLVDGLTGQQHWVETYEARASEMLDVQDEISDRIATSLAPAVLRSEMQRVSRRPPHDISAWDAALFGLWHLDRRTAQDGKLAREHFARALELDPTFVLPWYGDAMSHYADLFNGWSVSADRSLESLCNSASQARDVDPQDPHGYVAGGYAAFVSGDRDGAIALLERSIELNPSAVRARSLLANLLAFRGESDQALRILDTVMRLSPRDPLAWTFEAGRAQAHFAVGRHQEALECAQRAERSGPPDAMVQAMLAALYVLAGDEVAARRCFVALRTRWPEFSIQTIRRILVLMDPRQQQHFLGPLERLGF